MNTENENITGDSAIIVSYIPLLVPKRTQQMEQPTEDDTIRFFDDIDADLEVAEEAAHVKAIIWGSDDNKLEAVLVMEDAQAIVDHAYAWSEFQPRAWFRFYIKQVGERYCVLVAPVVEKTLMRWKSRPENAGRDIGTSLVMFVPLNYASKPTNMYDKIKDMLGDDIKVSFLDIKDMPQSVTTLSPDDVVEFATLRIGGDEMDSWIESNLEE